MPYGFKTPNFNIPVITLGDIVDPAEERLAALTIEQQLSGLIGAHSGGDGIFSVGEIEATFIAGASRVSIEPTFKGTSVQSFIRQVFVRSTDTLVFDGIPDSTTVFLIVRLIESTDSSSRVQGDVVVEFNDSGIIPDDGLLIATATTTGASISIDEDPPGRVAVPTVASHAATADNPHENPFHQDQIITSGMSVFGDANVAGNLTVEQLLRVLGQLVFDDGLEVFGEIAFRDRQIVSGIATFLGSFLAHSGAEIQGLSVFREMVVTSGIINRGNLEMFGNIIMVSGATVDGRNVKADAELLGTHINDLSNPHEVTLSVLSGLSLFGGTMLGNLDAMSGITFDGMDLSELRFLIDGSNADPVKIGGSLVKLGHTHNMSGIDVNHRGFSPEFDGAVFSGTGRGVISTHRDLVDKKNFYRWTGVDASDPLTAIQEKAIAQEVGLPGDFDLPSGLTVCFRGSGSDTLLRSVEVLDTDGDVVSLKDSGNLVSDSAFKDQVIGFIDPSSNTWVKGRFMTIIYNLASVSGTPIDLGRVNLAYRTVFPQP